MKVKATEFFVLLALLSLAAPFWGCDQTPTAPATKVVASSRIEWHYFSGLPDGKRGIADPSPLESFWARHPDWYQWSGKKEWQAEDGIMPALGFGEEPGRAGRCDLRAKVYFNLPEGHAMRAKLFFIASRCNGDPAIPMRISWVPEHFYNIPVQMGENVIQLERLPDWSGNQIPLLIFDQPPYSRTPRRLSDPDPGLEFLIQGIKLVFD